MEEKTYFIVPYIFEDKKRGWCITTGDVLKEPLAIFKYRIQAVKKAKSFLDKNTKLVLLIHNKKNKIIKRKEYVI